MKSGYHNSYKERNHTDKNCNERDIKNNGNIIFCNGVNTQRKFK